jgi:NADH dehydrogenase FAD-containing subunit
MSTEELYCASSDDFSIAAENIKIKVRKREFFYDVTIISFGFAAAKLQIPNMAQICDECDEVAQRVENAKITTP